MKLPFLTKGELSGLCKRLVTTRSAEGAAPTAVNIDRRDLIVPRDAVNPKPSEIRHVTIQCHFSSAETNVSIESYPCGTKDPNRRDFVAPVPIASKICHFFTG